MKINTDPRKIEEILTRGVEKIIDKDHLKKMLFSGRKLRIKHGIDPTGPNIHIGRATQLWKLRDFQKLGHQIVLIIGDFTAQVGDASDKQEMRNSLSEKKIRKNMKGYLKQIGKVLDVNKTELHYNSEWLNKLSAKDLIYLSTKFTAQQVIQRRNFKERWEKGKPIGLHELDYPLLQGYDSVAVRADIEIGGFDQLFNLEIGRQIQKMFNQKPQDIMTLKMLFGLDGKKMSTSWGNVVNITDEAKEIYGKIMSLKDELISGYFELCTTIPLKEVANIKRGLKTKKFNPRDIKIRLAEEITKRYYSGKKAEEVKEEFNKVFKEKKIPTKIQEIKIKEKLLNILDLLVKTKLVSSKSEAKRLILQKGVKVDGIVQANWQETIQIKKGMIIQTGKRKFIKVS